MDHAPRQTLIFLTAACISCRSSPLPLSFIFPRLARLQQESPFRLLAETSKRNLGVFRSQTRLLPADLHMNSVDGCKKKPKGLISKTFERCMSLGYTSEKHKVVPEGYFSVYVGSEKEPFFVKMSCMSHLLFRELLDEAEKEYGFASKGPLELPCTVDRFFRVLSEMEQEVGEAPRCASPMRVFNRGFAGYQMLSPSRLAMTGRSKSMR